MYQQPGLVPLPPGWIYASYGDRLAAYLLDQIFAMGCLLPGYLVSLVVSVVGTMAFRSPWWGLAGGVLGLATMIAGFVVFIRVHLLGTARRGQSWGKKTMGIYVLGTQDLLPIGVGAAVVRWLGGALVSLVTCGLGTYADLLWPLWDPRRQALHDKMASSLVVRRLG